MLLQNFLKNKYFYSYQYLNHKDKKEDFKFFPMNIFIIKKRFFYIVNIFQIIYNNLYL
jgi:hypothetical protein